MLLHTRSKLLSIHQKMDILDEDDRVVYTVESKVVSIHNTTTVTDADGQEVAVLTHKPISLHETHDIAMASGEKIELRTELFHFTDDVVDLTGVGWQLRGDMLQHNYEIVDGDGRVLATAHHKWASLHDVYTIDILDESQTDRIVCVYVALEKIIRERETRRANSEPQN